jgi:hypothetical protein
MQVQSFPSIAHPAHFQVNPKPTFAATSTTPAQLRFSADRPLPRGSIGVLGLFLGALLSAFGIAGHGSNKILAEQQEALFYPSGYRLEPLKDRAKDLTSTGFAADPSAVSTYQFFLEAFTQAIDTKGAGTLMETLNSLTPDKQAFVTRFIKDLAQTDPHNYRAVWNNMLNELQRNPLADSHTLTVVDKLVQQRFDSIQSERTKAKGFGATALVGLMLLALGGLGLTISETPPRRKQQFA